MNLAPIVLFVYNRIWHTRQTIEALQRNELARKSELFIYSDAPKDEHAIEKVNEVREYIKTIYGFKNITIIKQEKNIGLADSIIGGVTKIVNEYGKIIVLEDDIVTSPYFLKFMNEALDFYANEEKVWHISGWNYPIESKDVSETFLWRVMNCWGWATWKNRWQFYEKDTVKLIQDFSTEEIYKFNLDGAHNFWSQVLANKDNKINTWAIYWYATIFKNRGLCLNPVQTFINNIGFEGTATHCKSNKSYIDYLNVKNEILFNQNIKEDDKNLEKVRLYLNSLKKQEIVKRFSDTEYKRIRKTPRFCEVEVEFLRVPIKAPDAASLVFLNRELFGQEIYRFHTNSKIPYILDCGANIGISVIYFKKLFPNAKIVAFEPDKKIFDYLKFNINSFGFENVELINKGLWNEETILRFFSEGADGGRVANENDEQNIIEIETTKLSDYIKNQKVDFLKIDIEGAETNVLVECEMYLCNVEKIFIEYHSFIDKPQTLSTILGILENHGFRYYVEHIGVKSSHPFENITNYVGFDNQLNIFGYRV